MGEAAAGYWGGCGAGAEDTSDAEDGAGGSGEASTGFEGFIEDGAGALGEATDGAGILGGTGREFVFLDASTGLATLDIRAMEGATEGDIRADGEEPAACFKGGGELRFCA